MFFASAAKPIDDNLKNLVEKMEAQNPSLLVLSARQVRYNLRQIPVELTIKEPRQFNVLEEFIIRAGIEFDPPSTADELASVLGLDPIFIQSTIATLQSLQTLTEKSQITVTAEGKLFYEKGTVPQPPYSVQIYAIADSLGGNITFQTESLNEVTVNLPDLAKFINIDYKIPDISSLSLEKIQQNIQDSGLKFHVPEEGKIVTSFRVLSPIQIIWKTISIFVLFDANKNKVSIQIKSGGKILESASNWLESLLHESKFSLQALCELSNKTINFERETILNQKNATLESRVEKIRLQVLETANDSDPVIQLRDGQITQTYLEVLNSAKHQILMYSPWVNQAFVDDKFLTLLQKLVNRGVRILIGYGIARRQEDENRVILPEVEAKLQAIKTPEGLPGVKVFWLGNSHVKEVIVDQKIYLCGSHNWLFYLGKYLPLGESVYKVTIPEQVQEAYQFLAHRYQNHAQKLWENALQNRDSQLALETLSIWGALNMEDLGINEIEQNNWLELLPVWLNVVLQKIKAKNLPNGLETALALLSQVTGEESFVDLLRQGWREVLRTIALQNPQTAVNLLTNEVWEQFLRLKIAQENDSPDTLISPQTETQKPGKKKIGTKKSD